MKKKNEFTIIDIIGISLIFIVLVILVIPFVIKTIHIYEVDNARTKAITLLNAARTEYKSDISRGKMISAYCYRSDYGYPKTLNDSDTRSINNVDSDVSYYITFDERGYITSFVYADEKYAFDARENIDENYIETLDEENFNKRKEAILTINKCPYDSK